MHNHTIELREAERIRWEVDKAEDWRWWMRRIPSIPFQAGWRVRISPPFGGAMVRFRVSLDGHPDNECSVYLDVFDRIGCMNEPYWEVYPWQDDVGRCVMDDIDGLLKMISESLEYIEKVRTKPCSTE